MARKNPSIRRRGYLDPETAPQARQRAVQGVCKGILSPASDFRSPIFGLTALVNELPADLEPLTGIGNELALTGGDGWALIPYGDHPNTRGLQRFGKTSAQEMHGYFRNAWNTIKRAFVGMPIYRGHPDQADTVARERDREKDPAKRRQLDALVNEIMRRYPDRTIYGTIADIEVREDGLAIKPILTEAGAALVNEKGLKFFSPHWLARDLPAENGREIKEPIYLVSIGLTDRPNIAGTSLVNTQPDSPMKELIIKLLAALGRTSLTNEATDEQLNTELAAVVPIAQELVKRPEPTALVNEQTARTTAENELAATKEKLTQAETALANEQAAHAAVVKSRNEALVNEAVVAGRITEAQKPVWIGRLERDFDTEVKALANEQAVKTTPKTGDLGQGKAMSNAAGQFTTLVNERVSKGESWDAAWANVKRTAAGKALYEQMNAAQQ